MITETISSSWKELQFFECRDAFALCRLWRETKIGHNADLVELILQNNQQNYDNYCENSKPVNVFELFKVKLADLQRFLI